MAYSEYVKKGIVFYYEKELGCAQIVKALHKEQISVSKSGVWRFLKGYKERGSTKRKKGSGRPTVICEGAQKVIDQKMEEDETTIKELQRTLENHGYTVSESSVLRCHQQLFWTHCRSAYCQLIRERNKLKRLNWARKYLEEGSAGFRDVIFTDETSVQLECYRRFSYRKTGQLPRPKPKYVLLLQ